MSAVPTSSLLFNDSIQSYERSVSRQQQRLILFMLLFRKYLFFFFFQTVTPFAGNKLGEGTADKLIHSNFTIDTAW